MQSPLLFLFFSFLFSIQPSNAAGKTHIYIDQIPLYSKLASCAQDRLSAIVRAQSSGCGDDRQLTSFACFCIDSSSEFNSIISTAVQEQCSNFQAATTGVSVRAPTQTAAVTRAVLRRATSTAATAVATGVGKDVESALNIFNSYCSKSTELSRFGPTAPATVTITQGPQTIIISSPTDSASQDSGSKTPVAAIAVPATVVPLAAIAALFFFFRRRRSKHTQVRKSHDSANQDVYGRSLPPRELAGEGLSRSEMQGSKVVMYAHELDPATRAELDGGLVADRNLRADNKELRI